MATTMSSINFPGGGELVVTRELIEVHYMTDQDRNWKFTDAAGHRHRWSDSRGEWPVPPNYPTLKIVVDEIYWCGECRDEHTNEHLECAQCSERVRPGVTGPGTTYIQGQISATYDGEPVSEERVRELLDQLRAGRP